MEVDREQGIISNEGCLDLFVEEEGDFEDFVDMIRALRL